MTLRFPWDLGIFYVLRKGQFTLDVFYLARWLFTTRTEPIRSLDKLDHNDSRVHLCKTPRDPKNASVTNTFTGGMEMKNWFSFFDPCHFSMGALILILFEPILKLISLSLLLLLEYKRTLKKSGVKDERKISSWRSLSVNAPLNMRQPEMISSLLKHLSSSL